ncbi:MAG TPA: DUF2254 domain-containing protein [Nocardioidaceae bacterium]|nr:DUF2254 domain-containing protein [Nocardioidaceae bacterium]
MRREAVWEYLRGALWALPTLAVVLALLAGSILTRVHVSPNSTFGQFLFQGTPDDARTLLIAVASTMATVIAVVLGLTLVALQLASTQFSPRLLHSFLRDRSNQVVLSIFVATFTYSTAGLYTVGVSGGERIGSFPRLAVTGALVLLFVSLVTLVYFVHHLAHSIQIDEIMSKVERTTLVVIERDLPSEAGAILPEVPAWAVQVPAYRSGYVQVMHPEVWLDVASRLDATAMVVPMIGEHVVAQAPLAWVWRASPEQPPPPPEEFAAVAHDTIRIGIERTAEQDAAFGIRQLADMGVKALSPAINDPYTAIQAVEHIAVVLAALTQRPLGNQQLHDADGAVRVLVRRRDLVYYLDLATGQVRRYGASEPRVVRALLRVLRNTGAFCRTDADREAVAFQVRLVREAAEDAIRQSADLAPVRDFADEVLREVTG